MYDSPINRESDISFDENAFPSSNASFYFYRRSYFNLGYKGAITDKSLVYVMPHTCFDLDHPIDFEVISYLICNNKLDFAL